MRRQPLRSTTTAVRKVEPVALLQSYDSGINPSRPIKSSPLASSTIAGLPLELLDRLRAFPLFQSAPESFLLSIGKSLRPSIYQPSQEIVREGEDAKAMYWLVRGSVRVTSRDGESTYAELKPGSFFGEIGILMGVPRTATIVASVRSMVVRLNKEDLQKELPSYPDVEKSIREEALERLAILDRKKKERGSSTGHLGDAGTMRPPTAPRKRSRDWIAGDVEMGEAGAFVDGEVLSNKRRKSPSPSVIEMAASSALGTAPLTIRRLLKELPLFASLPDEIPHYLGCNAHLVSFPPFTEVVKQGTAGRDVYFVVKGDVEVLQEVIEASRSNTKPQKHHDTSASTTGAGGPHMRFKARLKPGQYFGEVTNLALSPKRTATVRSVQSVECLLITGEVLDELWTKCSPEIRQQVERVAKGRLHAADQDEDIVMSDVDAANGIGGISTEPAAAEWRKRLPTVTFEEPIDLPMPINQLEPIDPDPFFNPELDNMRAKSRRASLAPPSTNSDAVPYPTSRRSSLAPPLSSPSDGQQVSLLESLRTNSPPTSFKYQPPSPRRRKPTPTDLPTSPLRLSPTTTRRPSLARHPSNADKGRLPDALLLLVLQHLDLLDLMRLRRVSMHWHNLLTTSPNVLTRLDLSRYNTYITDDVLRDVIVPFIGSRPKDIDLSNCFHITDDGFKHLVDACGESAVTWRMKSVWDVSGPAVLSLIEKARHLEEIDLSNCRKVGDNLLARVVGWIVPPNEKAPPPPPPTLPNGRRKGKAPAVAPLTLDPPQPPGTVVGAPKLKRLTLSYCKHIQDRSMSHLALHAASRLESLDLTRCTSISDLGFHSWGTYNFPNLKKLILADCTYLSDQAIVGVVGGCRSLQDLDLSFCCALSDTATEVLSLGLPQLRRLNLAFCGSAVSDNSLRCIGLHLLELRYLSVRGCVRVTGQGVESVVEGCRNLREFDVSQCKNLRPWIERAGMARVNGRREVGGWGRSIKFDVVADGTWRAGR
nr:hypothetical protein B0A51_08779 [Rachicladosporium sp. CCFEE 5018]